VSLGAGTYTVRVQAPRAQRVEIMGDFTSWKPADLAEAPNGWWTIVTQITPGARQMNVRLDGGPWTVPAGATVETDEYGAAVGVVIVR
jgi:1,4-alpha-glucan branching enzyme